MRHASCRGCTELFFPENHDPVAPALAVCAGCPVRAQCAELGDRLDVEVGVWGGVDRRRRLRATG
jgi:WhiB family redox-sensing transcriptional regulator